MNLLKRTGAALMACMVIAALLTGCGNASSSSSASASNESTSSSLDAALLPTDGWQKIDWSGEGGTPGELEAVYTPKYAQGFEIEYYYGGAKIIQTHIPATANTSAYSQSILVLPEGSVEPTGDRSYDYRLEGELDRVLTFASSHAGFFSMLEETSIIKGSSIKPESCFLPSLKTALEQGDTVYVGSGQNADKELMVSLEPQIVTVGGMQTDVDTAHKLEESGVFCLYFGDFAEDHYMGRAEWLTLVGALCGREQQAQNILKESEAAANDLIQRAAAIQDKPTVLWYTHSSQAPHWNVRTEQDYVNSMVSALGGQLLYPEGTESNSVRLSNEDFLPLMMEADRIVLGVSLNSYPTAEDMTFFNKEGQIDFSQAPAYQANGCYVVGYDWAQDTANVPAILESFAIALYPEEFADLQNPGKLLPFGAQ